MLFDTHVIDSDSRGYRKQDCTKHRQNPSWQGRQIGIKPATGHQTSQKNRDALGKAQFARLPTQAILCGKGGTHRQHTGGDDENRGGTFDDFHGSIALSGGPIWKGEHKVILDDIRNGGKAAMAAALALTESAPNRPETVALLDAAFTQPKGHVIGFTGPPGVGKSTLLNTMIGQWRQLGRTVACIAVDPSSRRSGGALLGDRTRLTVNPEDSGIFFRSMAARDRLGGLAALTVPAMVLMRALYDVVVIETVGVGQSETDVSQVADTVVFCVQPGSGDSLQFMKAGIAEIPHVAAVTKADMEREAIRAVADVKGALSLAAQIPGEDWPVPVILVSSRSHKGIPELVTALDDHRSYLEAQDRLAINRAAQARHWLDEAVSERFGSLGLGLVRTHGGSLGPDALVSPFRLLSEISRHLSIRWQAD